MAAAGTLLGREARAALNPFFSSKWRYDAIAQESFCGVAKSDIQGQYDEQPLQPDVGDILRRSRPDHGPNEDAHQFGADQRPENRNALGHHVGDDADDHAHQHG